MDLICKVCRGARFWSLTCGMCNTCYRANPGRRHTGLIDRKPGKWYFDRGSGTYHIFWGDRGGSIYNTEGGRGHWRAFYSTIHLGNFKTLRRAKAWIEEVAPQIDDGEGYDTGPESERGPDWFGNDGIDGRMDAAVAQHP